jgi:uncharacterized membrane protein SirB2
MWTLIKHLHIALALLSFGGFMLRGGLMLMESRLLNRPLFRRGPHLVDSLLLASGVALAWQTQQYPFVNSYWLTAKMLALLAYIGFGMIALNYGRSRPLRLAALCVAIGCGAYMIATALQHNPLLAARGAL